MHSSKRRGDHDVICDRCGFRYSARLTKFEWTSFRVCGECWEPKHPQLDLKGFSDKQTVPDARPPQPLRFRSHKDGSIHRPETVGPSPIIPYDPTRRD